MKSEELDKVYVKNERRGLSETDYWLSLLYSAGFGNEKHADLINKNIEIRKMLTSTINTTKRNNSVSSK